MTPLHASWLVKACIVLHNRCIDWGLRKLKRGQNRDLEHEMDIQVRAHMRFTMYNQEIAEEDLPDEAERYGATNEGIVRRAQYVFKNYGGPTPQQGVLGRQRGRVRRRGRGQGQGPSCWLFLLGFLLGFQHKKRFTISVHASFRDNSVG